MHRACEPERDAPCNAYCVGDVHAVATLLQRAKQVLALAYYGLHHVPGKIKDHGVWIEVNVHSSLATFDFDNLTRLVVGAHDACVRLEIQPSGPGRLRLLFHDRRRDGRMSQRHPTIEQAIAAMRSADSYRLGTPADAPVMADVRHREK